MSRKKTSFDESFERALQAAATQSGPEISMGAARFRQGRGETFTRYVGSAKLTIKYKGVRREPGGTTRPWYVVVVSVGKLKHKISLGAAASWHESHVTPTAKTILDEIASSAISFATSPDDDTPEDVASDVSDATQSALKEDGSYDVRESL